MIRQPVKLLLGFFLTLGVACPVVAAGQAAPAETTRRPHRDDLQVRGLPEKELIYMVDWQSMAVASLAAERANHSAAERAEFDDVMFQLLDQAYRRLIRSLAGHDIEMMAEEIRPDGLIRRKFLARSLKSPGDTIEFHLLFKREDEEWSLQDFATEEVSIVKAYRSQFLKILKNQGFAVLIQKMKAKVERDRTEEP